MSRFLKHYFIEPNRLEVIVFTLATWTITVEVKIWKQWLNSDLLKIFL